MSKESRAWRPSRWTGHAVELRMQRILKHALKTTQFFFGSYEGNLRYAQMVSEMQAEESRRKLSAMGIRTLGEA